MWREYNPNPTGRKTGDCVIRALCYALGKDWLDVYAVLTVKGLLQGDWGNANNVWGAVLRDNGFVRFFLPDECPDCYTVSDFCADNPKGLFVLATGSHVLTVCDGCYYDSWDSGDQVPTYVWRRDNGSL